MIIFFILFLFIIFFNRPNNICLIYNYYEKNTLYKDNFTYFLQNGILDNIDYYIVINGESTVEIPNKKNIFVFFRQNIGYDFGAYSYIIHNKLTRVYDYYFFMNTSVKGPYTKYNTYKWYEPFLTLFNHNTHLVGTSINICTYKKYTNNVCPHVQSMFFVLDNIYFNQLKNEGFFNESQINNMTFDELIQFKEIGLSTNALNKGYNINCLLSKYKGLDYINITTDINPTSHSGDPYYPNAYFGNTIDPYEVIFYKNTRI